MCVCVCVCVCIYIYIHTGCPTTYQTLHFFNNSKTNEDIATRFEQEYARCVRNEEECVCSAPSCCDTEQRYASQPACILPDSPLCLSLCHLTEDAYTIRLLFVSVVYSVSSHSWKIYRYTLEERVFIVRTYWKTELLLVVAWQVNLLGHDQQRPSRFSPTVKPEAPSAVVCS